MKKPNFFILGAPKCGTTSLAAWLAKHPNVFMSPIKEPNFFNTDAQKYIEYSPKEYTQLYSNAGPQHTRVGEATTNYLFSQEAVPNILSYVDNHREVKFIVSIRNPVDMAISLHGQRLREGREVVKDFPTAWHLQETRAKGLSLPPLSDAGSLMYGPICSLGEQIERLFRVVDREQVHLIVLDDIKKNPRLEYKRVLDFLELPDDGRQQFPIYNEARSIPLWVARLERGIIWAKGRLAIRQELGLLRGLNRKLFQPGGKDPVGPEMLAELRAYYDHDIALLSSILERDFTSWLQPMPMKQ